MSEQRIQPSERQTALALFQSMNLARKFEEKVWEYFKQGQIYGTTHLAIGEEGTAAGTCLALKRQDRIYTTHRGHCHVICKGADINGMMAEMFARETGVCRGRGGSMHMIDPSAGVMGANGIVGPAPSLACGSAFAIVRHGEKDAVAAAFFGDGATGEGAVHEAMNLASVWNLPVMFVLENNGYGMSTPIATATRDTDLAKRAIPYGMEAVEVDGNDALAVYRAVSQVRETILKTSRPVLVVEHTYRISGHSKSDKNYYRSAEEIASWKERDPILLLKNRLLNDGVATAAEIAEITAEADRIIGEAVAYAETGPLPSVEEACHDVYREGGGCRG